jgi:hypothetical protein
MIDPLGLRDESVVALDELLDLTVGRHPLSFVEAYVKRLLRYPGVGS